MNNKSGCKKKINKTVSKLKTSVHQTAQSIVGISNPWIGENICK